jgi:CBS domain containing-hemolysin-like protein
VLRVLGRVPETGERAEIAVPDPSDPEEPRELLAVLTVERMEGLRIDRVGLRLLDGPDGTDEGQQEGWES